MVAFDETSLRLTLSMLTEDVLLLPVPAVKISSYQLVYYSVEKEIMILLVPGFGLQDSGPWPVEVLTGTDACLLKLASSTTLGTTEDMIISTNLLFYFD